MLWPVASQKLSQSRNCIRLIVGASCLHGSSLSRKPPNHGPRFMRTLERTPALHGRGFALGGVSPFFRAALVQNG